jgi:hypothetical protein
MGMLVLTVKVTGYGSRGPLFEGTIDDQVVVTGTTQPLFSTARALLAKGTNPDDVLVMRHAGSNTVSLRARVGVAAKLTVTERAKSGPTFARWEASESSGGVSRIDETDEAAAE